MKIFMRFLPLIFFAFAALPSHAEETLPNSTEIIASKMYVDRIIGALASEFATVAQGELAETAVQPATLDNYIPILQKGAASGVASLDPGAKVPYLQLPTGSVANTIAAGDDERFDTAKILSSAPVENPPSGRVFFWVQ